MQHELYEMLKTLSISMVHCIVYNDYKFDHADKIICNLTESKQSRMTLNTPNDFM